VSDLPAGWEWARLGDLGTDVRGSVKPEPATTYELYSVPTYPTGRPELLRGDEIGSSKRPVEPGDVLLCKINPRINRVWAVADPSGAGPQIASTEYLVFRTPVPRLSAYLRWYFHCPSFRRWIELSAEGATGSHTRAKSGPILEQLIPIPPVGEQARIVAAIEEHLSHLDAVECLFYSIQQRLERFALTAVATRSTWPRVAIGDVAEVFVGTTPKRSETHLWGGPVAWVSSGEVAFCRIFRTRETVSEDAVKPDRVHPPGTVLMAMIGEGKTRGQVAILDIPAAHNQNSAAIRPNSQVVLSEWLYQVLKDEYLANRRVGSGNNQPALNKARVSTLTIPLPPLSEQQTLIAERDRVAMVIDRLLGDIATSGLRASSLRRLILASAFAGKLVPQDPEDEPVSVLRERIRDQRAGAMPARRTRTPAASR